jgi:glycosyltransferase involved in cell wall biosynthesis
MQDELESPRTLIFSQRNLSASQPYRCAHFEFEDVISMVDRVKVLAPRIDASNRQYLFAKRLGYHTPLKIHPGVENIQLQSDYDVFFAMCGNPTDLLRISAVEDWRNHCKKAVCLIDEVWVKQIASYRRYLEMLKKFDLVVLYYKHSVEPINKLIGDKCVFLPPGVDTIRFCPFPNQPDRNVDVYSVGRRSAVTHKAFLRMAAGDSFFYLHDTTTADQVLDTVEHRMLLANIAKRSRYFVVNPGLIDRPDLRGTQIEIGNRYFEAAAAGCILLGERPSNGEFDKLFDWSDSLVEMTYDSPDAEKIVRDLDQQPDRQKKIRRANVQQCLLRHDWVYRWESILKAVGLNPLPELETRKSQLRGLAASIASDGVRQSANPSQAGLASSLSPSLVG